MARWGFGQERRDVPDRQWARTRMKTWNITTLTNFYNKTKSDAKTTNLYTSDMITYSAEREYPPKNFDSKIEETATMEILK
jgi:hypothetical protein